MHHVFISYSRTDSQLVEQLVSALETHRIQLWIDRRDIPVSVPWLDEVRRGIREADLFVVCESFAWYESRACAVEAGIAVESQKRIVHVDLAASGAQAAAATVARAYANLTLADRTAVELAVDTEAWVRLGRSRKQLPARKALRRYRKLAKQPGRALTAESRAYIHAARRRALRRSIAAGLGVTVLYTSYTSERALDRVSNQYNQTINQQTQIAGDAFQAVTGSGNDVYTALNTAGRFKNIGSSFLKQTQLMAALNVPVPDDSRVADGATLLGFTDNTVDADGPRLLASSNAWGVLGKAGLARQGTLPPHAASAVAGSDSSDSFAAVLGSGIVVAVKQGRQRTDPCPAATTVGLSPAGNTVVSAGTHGACVWHIGDAQGHEVRLYAGSSITAVAATDTRLVLGLANGSVAIGPPNGPFTVQPPPSAHAGAVTQLAISADGSLAAAATAGSSSVAVFATADGSLHRSLSCAGVPGALAFSPDAQVLAVGISSQVELEDLADGVEKVMLQGDSGDIEQVAWSTDGAGVWALSSHDRASHWTWRTGTVYYDDPQTWFVGLSGSSSGTYLVGSRDGALRLVDPAHNTTRTVYTSPTQPIYSSASDTSGRYAAIGTDGTVSVVNLGTRTTINALLRSDCPVGALGFSPDDRTVYAACSTGLYEIDPLTGAVRRKIVVPEDGFVSLAVASRSGDVFLGGQQGRLYEVSAGSATAVLLKKAGTAVPVSAVAVSADGHEAVFGADGLNSVGNAFAGTFASGSWTWNATAFPDSVSTAQEARSIAMSPDGSHFAVGFVDGLVEVMETDSLNPDWTWTEAQGAIRGMVYTASGDLVISTRDGIVAQLTACPDCESTDLLIGLAARRVAQARALGLAP